MLRKLLAGAAIVLCPGAASAADSIMNGGFENPKINDPCCNTVPPALLPNWTATPNVNVVNGTFSSTNGNLAYEGTQYLDLVGQGGSGSISQTFATIMGETYNLSFAYSHNLFTQIPSASADFSVDGLSGTVTHSTGSNANLDWRNYFGSFVASGTSATLNFTNVNGGTNEGILLDAVSVQAVPEASTWAMMLLGFGAVGAAMRSARRRKPSFQAIA